jgi:phosphohistidine phosphatase SixA
MTRVIEASMLVALLLAAPSAGAQPLSGQPLVKALQRGGYVLVMRHASSPREVPDERSANRDNVNRERQLDDKGRATATAMGEAFRSLRVPVGEVLTSPTYRAGETVRLARLPNTRPQPELGDGGQSMQGVTPAQTAWLKKKATEFPRGTNTVLVTHLPNMSAAFPEWTAGLEDGETLVLGSDGKGGPALVARVKIEQWPHLMD